MALIYDYYMKNLIISILKNKIKIKIKIFKFRIENIELLQKKVSKIMNKAEIGINHNGDLFS